MVLLGHVHSFVMADSGFVTLLLITRVSPIVGNLSDISPSEEQACLDRNNRLVAGVKYTISLVLIVEPVVDTPDMRRGRAPMMSIPLLLAAVIVNSIIGMIELTVPYEDRMEVANELKRSKYEDLKRSCEENNWKVALWPVEVGVRGFTGASLAQVLKELGVVGKKRRDCIKRMSSEAEAGSRILWGMHRVPEWGRQENLQRR